MVHSRFEPDEAESLLRAHRMLGNLGHKRDVLVGREARDQIVELEHETNVLSAIVCEAPILKGRQFQILKEQTTARRAIDAAHYVQQGRFAASRRPQQHHHFSGPNVEIQSAQRAHLNVADV
jgi:hypothetical protein